MSDFWLLLPSWRFARDPRLLATLPLRAVAALLIPYPTHPNEDPLEGSHGGPLSSSNR
jgi:hypothetical protein